MCKCKRSTPLETQKKSLLVVLYAKGTLGHRRRRREGRGLCKEFRLDLSGMLPRGGHAGPMQLRLAAVQRRRRCLHFRRNLCGHNANRKLGRELHFSSTGQLLQGFAEITHTAGIL